MEILQDYREGKLKKEEASEAIASVCTGKTTIKLHKWTNSDNELESRLSITKSQLRNIIDQVRKKLLHWSLELEKKGIIGENLSFTNEEKAEAKKLQQTFITNIYGSSNVNVSQAYSEQGNIEQYAKLELSNLSVIEQELKNMLNALSSDIRKIIEAKIKELEKESKSQNPKLERIKKILFLLDIKEIIQSSNEIVAFSGKIIELIDKFLS